MTMLGTAIVYTAWPAFQQFRWRAKDGAGNSFYKKWDDNVTVLGFNIWQLSN